MIVHDEWIKSSLIRAEIKMDEFIIMPNHLHGIVFIRDCVERLEGRPPDLWVMISHRLPLHSITI